MDDTDVQKFEQAAAREIAEHGFHVEFDAFMPYAVVGESRNGRWLIESKCRSDGLWYRCVQLTPCGGYVKGLWARDVAAALEWYGVMDPDVVKES